MRGYPLGGVAYPFAVGNIGPLRQSGAVLQRIQGIGNATPEAKSTANVHNRFSLNLILRKFPQVRAILARLIWRCQGGVFARSDSVPDRAKLV